MRTFTDTRPVLVDYICERCVGEDKGVYRFPWNGAVKTSNPPQYTHECNKCGHTKTFNEQYPLIKFFPAGTVLPIPDAEYKQGEL